MYDVTIGVKKLNELATMPVYKTLGSAGADITSVIDCVILPGERKLLPTGLAVDIPLGWEIQIRPRSGLALKNGITVVNAPGTIDQDYQNEIGIILINHSTCEFKVAVGDRIAQMIVSPAHQARFKEIKNITTESERTGGFGSTGVGSTVDNTDRADGGFGSTDEVKK